MLLDELERLGVEIFLNTEVKDIRYKTKDKRLFQIETKAVEHKKSLPGPRAPNIICSKFCILSAGGKTYPALGSNGSGYDLARSLGHSIIDPVPSALPLEGVTPFSKKIPGTKFEMTATSIINDEEIKTSTDDVMFTSYGLSGPAIFNISREISIAINREQRTENRVKLNFLPGYSAETALEMLEKRWEKRPEQRLEKSLYGLFPNKFVGAFLEIVGISPQLIADSLQLEEKQHLAEQLTNYVVPITATRSWNEAEFTAGGVDTYEIKSSTLSSLISENLYMCGEILNVDGDVGGFNLSWAWSSGWVVGQLA